MAPRKAAWVFTAVAAAVCAAGAADRAGRGRSAPPGVCLAGDGFCRPDFGKLLADQVPAEANLDRSASEIENEGGRGLVDFGDFRAWIVDGSSLVIGEKRMPILALAGAVRVTKDAQGLVRGHYTLANDVDFELVPLAPPAAAGAAAAVAAEGTLFFRVAQKTTTRLQGTPTEMVIEKRVADTFLNPGTLLHVQRVAGPGPLATRLFVSTVDSAGKRSSVQLVPQPRFLALPEAAATGSGTDIEGFWFATAGAAAPATHGPRRSLTLSLSITRMDRESYLLVLEGLNTHKAVLRKAGALDADDRSWKIDSLYSTHLKASSHDLSRLEDQFVSLLSLADVCYMEAVPVGPAVSAGAAVSAHSSLETPPSAASASAEDFAIRLVFQNSAHPEAAAYFHRAPYAQKDRDFKHLPLTRWTWIPATYQVFQDAGPDRNALLPTQDFVRNSNESVTLEMRRAGPTTILDLFAGVGTHIRAMTMQSALAGREPLRVVAVERSNPDDDSRLTALFLTLLSTYDSIDADAADAAHLTIVAPQASLSFESGTVPTPGLWVLDRRFSRQAGQALSPDIHDRSIKLAISRDGPILKAVVHGHGVIGELHIENFSAFPSVYDWRVNQYVTRPFDVFASHGFPSDASSDFTSDFSSDPESAGPGGGAGDEEVAQLISDGMRVVARRSGGVAALSLVSDNRDVLTFVHPLDLTASLLGEWRLTSLEVGGEEAVASGSQTTYMKLVPSGVGELSGLLHEDQQDFALRMTETQRADGSGVAEARGVRVSIDLFESGAAAKGALVPVAWDVSVTPVNSGKERAANPFVEPIFDGASAPSSAAAGGGSEGGSSGAAVPRVHELLTSAVDVTVDGFTLTVENRESGGKAIFEQVVDTRVQSLLQGTWIVEFATAESDELVDVDGVSVPALTVAVVDHGAPVRHVLVVAPDSTGDSTTAAPAARFVAAIRRLPDGRDLGRFAFTVDPHGFVRIFDVLRFVGPEKQDRGAAVQDSGAADLENLIFDFFRDITAEPAPAMVEVHPGELIFTNGDSLLAMTRANAVNPLASVLIFSTVEIMEGPAAAVQDGWAPDQDRRQPDLLRSAAGTGAARAGAADEEEEVPPVVYAAAMMRKVRRRLMAASTLAEHQASSVSRLRQ